MVDPGLFGDFHKGNCTCNQMQSLYSTDCDNLPILYLVEPVFVPNVGICQSRQIVNNFPVRSRKTKIFTCNQMQLMYSTDSDILLILFSSLNRFVPKNVGFAKSRQIANISRQIPLKPKYFTWKYIPMNPNGKSSFKVERSRSP